MFSASSGHNVSFVVLFRRAHQLRTSVQQSEDLWCYQFLCAKSKQGSVGFTFFTKLVQNMEVILIFFKLILFTSEHNFSYTFSAYDRLIIEVT